jgi:FkbM family methyltransferase
VSSGALQGCELLLPVGETWAEALLTGSYERRFTRALLNAAKPGHVSYDLGAHLGYYSLILARAAGPQGEVHAFEPYAPNAARLRHHVERNATRGAPISVHECAIGVETGAATLVASGDVGVLSTLAHLEGTAGVLVPEWRERFQSFDRIETEAWRLDDWIEHAGVRPPDLIKIDIEGGELDALRGAERTLATARPLLLMELHNAGLAAECGNFLGLAGYRIEIINAKRSGDCAILARPG